MIQEEKCLGPSLGSLLYLPVCSQILLQHQNIFNNYLVSLNDVSKFDASRYIIEQKLSCAPRVYNLTGERYNKQKGKVHHMLY